MMQSNMAVLAAHTSFASSLSPPQVYAQVSYDFKANYSYVLQVFRDTNTKVSIKYKIKVLTMLLQILVEHNRQTDTNQGPVKGRAGVHTAAVTSTGGNNGGSGRCKSQQQQQW